MPSGLLPAEPVTREAVAYGGGFCHGFSPPPPGELVQGTASGRALKVTDPLDLPRLPCNPRKELDAAQGES